MDIQSPWILLTWTELWDIPLSKSLFVRCLYAGKSEQKSIAILKLPIEVPSIKLVEFGFLIQLKDIHIWPSSLAVFQAEFGQIKISHGSTESIHPSGGYA